MAERLYIQNRRKRERRRRLIRNVFKAILAVGGCALLLWLLGHTVTTILDRQEGTQEEIAGISFQEAGNLAWLLLDTAGEEAAQALYTLLQQMGEGEDAKTLLTNSQARQMLQLFPDGESARFLKALEGKKVGRVRADDWYEWFDAVRAVYDETGRIRDTQTVLLAAGEEAVDAAGQPLDNRRILTRDGVFYSHTDRLLDGNYRFCRVEAVERDAQLYAVRSAQKTDLLWKNVWITGADREFVRCFLSGWVVAVPALFPEGASLPAEQVADVELQSGRVTRLTVKSHKISGRLLRIADGGAEIEGHGLLPFSDDLKIYRLYQNLTEQKKGDLLLGYAGTDFVVENGVIEAALMQREEDMKTIRVLIKTSGYAQNVHQSVALQADCGCTVISGQGETEKREPLAAGETLLVDTDSPLFENGDRIFLVPDILTGRISLPNVERAQGPASYRGSFELLRTSEGIALINEVLLEEYLYAVLPGEMPSSYPMEAQKCQAVCARTYAYEKMLHAGLPAYGAHLDDSVSYQVYNNIGENESSTLAVKQTAGEMLFYEDQVAQAYYYSTSCGFGTDASVWQEGNEQAYPYLVSREIKSGGTYYEQEEPWFSWRYQVTDPDLALLEQKLASRYRANPQEVLTLQPDGSFASSAPPSLGEIREISVAKEGSGGVAKELLITGKNASVLVKSEYAIRYVLCDGKAQVLRQDNSLVDAPSLLPSAFFTVETTKENGRVTGYVLSGGGYGHGVGLSQNGARQMALSGMRMEEILAFFYQGCRIETIDS